MRGADLVVRMLLAHGVDVVYGVPGDTNVPFYDALREAQDHLRHVMTRDERSAGYMADAYARLTNRPAVVEVPSGAGAMYALPPIAEAHESSVPVILITCDTPLRAERRGVITELDCAKLFEPVTKGSWQVKSAARIPDMIRRAFRTATGGRPGAVHLVFPEDVLEEEVDLARVSLHADEATAVFPSHRPAPPAAQVEKLLEMIRAASRPLLIAGGGVNRSAAGKALRKVAERFGVPVVNTITGQTAMPDQHPLAIGVIGDNGFHPHANRAVEAADLIVYLGCRVGSVVTVGWTFPAPDAGRKVVQIDLDPEVLGNNTENALSMLGDARQVLEMLAAMADEEPFVDPEWVALINGWRKEFWRDVEPEMAVETVPLKPQRVVKALTEQLHYAGPVSILSDPGTPTPHMTRLLKLSNENSTFIIPRAFGGLGYALPAVVGAWLARPEARPIGLFGDGSFGMNCGELETLARLQVPAILIHFNNGCYGWIKALQRLHGHNATYSVDFTQLDAARIAEAFGLKAYRATDGAALDAALRDAFAQDRPCFIDVVVESIADVAPPVMSWLRRAGRDPLDPQGELRLAELSGTRGH